MMAERGTFFVPISIPDGLTKSAFISRLSAILSWATTYMAGAEDVVFTTDEALTGLFGRAA